MRDDVREYFSLLLEHLEKKTELLTTLVFEEKNLSSILKYSRDHDDEILSLIGKESSIIEMIDAEDFEISRIRDIIIHKSGLDFDKILTPGYNSDKDGINRYREKVLNINKILENFRSLREENNVIMDDMLKDIQIQADELSRMCRLRYTLPKGLRSS